MSAPSLHVVAFGATSFVGQILCRYLLDQFGVDGELRWAAAGRSQTKLEALRESLGPEARTLPLLVADAARVVPAPALGGPAVDRAADRGSLPSGAGALLEMAQS